MELDNTGSAEIELLDRYSEFLDTYTISCLLVYPNLDQWITVAIGHAILKARESS